MTPMELLTGLLAFFLTFWFAELIGYFYHRFAHVPGTSLYRAHMRHHLEAYPPKDYISKDKYRFTGRSSFIVWFAPLFVVYVGIQFLVFPLWLFLFTAGASVMSAVTNVAIHHAQHVEKLTIGGKWFEKVRAMHMVHHANMRKNFGIWQFFFDRAFGTKKESLRKSRP